MKVLSYGSLNLDYVFQVDHFVRPGETMIALDRQVFPGGKGLNQSIALSRAGAQVYHAGAIGQDGEMLRRLLEENGVDTRYLRVRSQVGTGNAIIQVNRSGNNCILAYGGSNQTMCCLLYTSCRLILFFNLMISLHHALDWEDGVHVPRYI